MVAVYSSAPGQQDTHRYVIARGRGPRYLAAGRSADEGEINRIAVRPSGLRFVACFLPAVPGFGPVLALLRRPDEIRRAQNAGERPSGIVVDIGRKAQFGSASHDTRQRGDAFV